MMEKNLTVGTVRSVGENEKKLYGRGISIRVTSIARDGRTLICAVCQHRRSLLARPMNGPALAIAAEKALAPLLSAGYIPMIETMDPLRSQELIGAEQPDPLDPIGLISALKDAGLPFPRLAIGNDPEVTTHGAVSPFWRKALGLFAT